MNQKGVLLATNLAAVPQRGPLGSKGPNPAPYRSNHHSHWNNECEGKPTIRNGL